MNSNHLQQLQGLMQLAGGFRASRVVLTANNLGVFEYLSAPKTAARLAARLRTDTRATEILLDALTALGLLVKTGKNYRNTGTANNFLMKKSPGYQGDMLRHLDTLWQNWSGLDEVVETGLPNRAGKRDHEAFIRAMHNIAVLRARDVVNAINLNGVKRALDLGGGPGTYSIELARRGASVTLFDLPNTIQISRSIVAQSKVRNIEFLRGDFHLDDIGSGYDLVFISQIVHSLSPAESLGLLKKAHAALNPNGRIVVQEFLLGPDRAKPVQGALFSVNMLVNTTAGRCYTPEEMKKWLAKIGFRGVTLKAIGDTVLLMGKKP